MTGIIVDVIGVMCAVFGIVVAFIIAGLLLGLSEMIGDEMRGWLELAPCGILRLVALRLPAAEREAIYSEEWLPELLYRVRNGEGRPITRLIIGTRYAASMARLLGGVRNPV